jgi:hypothetical protein
MHVYEIGNMITSMIFEEQKYTFALPQGLHQLVPQLTKLMK